MPVSMARFDGFKLCFKPKHFGTSVLHTHVSTLGQTVGLASACTERMLRPSPGVAFAFVAYDQATALYSSALLCPSSWVPRRESSEWRSSSISPIVRKDVLIQLCPFVSCELAGSIHQVL